MQDMNAFNLQLQMHIFLYIKHQNAECWYLNIFKH